MPVGLTVIPLGNDLYSVAIHLSETLIIETECSGEGLLKLIERLVNAEKE